MERKKGCICNTSNNKHSVKKQKRWHLRDGIGKVVSEQSVGSNRGAGGSSDQGRSLGRAHMERLSGCLTLLCKKRVILSGG